MPLLAGGTETKKGCFCDEAAVLVLLVCANEVNGERTRASLATTIPGRA